MADSDTECIIHLYEEYGTECLQYLQGMFGFAIMDKKNNSLFIARDRLGIKPMFYYQDHDKFVFASEIKSILSYDRIDKEVDFTGMDAFFTYTYIPAPKTIFKNIQKLEPGYFLMCKDGKIAKQQYWDIYFEPDYGKSEKDFAEEFVDLFSKTVKSHLMSDVPLGMFLSGGIDSGLVLAMMSNHNNQSVNSFTMGFAGETGGYFDERIYARKLAKRYNARYNEYDVKPELEQIIDSIVKSFDEPFADDSVIPSYHICRLTSDRVKVALTGLGGDELFGGYERYLGLKMSYLYNKLPLLVRNRIINPIVEKLPEPKSDNERISQLKRFVSGSNLPPDKRYQSYISSHNEDNFSLYNQEIHSLIDNDNVVEMSTRYFSMDNASDLLDRAYYQDIKMYLPDDILVLSDRLGMHHSLELRVPFVDHKVVEFCAKIPSCLKIKWAKKKYLLKKIARPYLTADIINHPKQGFASPMTSWLRQDLKNYVKESLSKERLSIHGFFNEEYVENIIDDHMDRKNNNYKIIFSLLMFQKWYENYML